MKKILMTLAALVCCSLNLALAQDPVEQAWERAQQKTKLADKHPSNGSMQYQAAFSLIVDELADRQDPERALVYANRALKIAEKQRVPKDTLLGHTCSTLGLIYLKLGRPQEAFDAYEKSVAAMERELGRFNAATVYNKLVTGYSMMMLLDISYGSLLVQEAFLDNERIPVDERIQNLSEMSALYEMAIDIQVAKMTQVWQYALPMVVLEGRRYLIVETPDWSMEQPMVGWLVPDFLCTMQGQEKKEGNVILVDQEDRTAPLRVITPDDEIRPEYKFNFVLDSEDSRYLKFPADNGGLWYLPKGSYNLVLARYRAFKANNEADL